MNSATVVPTDVFAHEHSLPPSHELNFVDLNESGDRWMFTTAMAIGCPEEKEEEPGAILNVQLPFSLDNHDHDSEVIVSDAPLLVKCPKGNLLRLGFASCDLESHAWQLLPSSFLVPELPSEFRGAFCDIFTGRGLIMMAKFAKQTCHFIVSNPMTKSQHQLPPMLNFPSPGLLSILGIFVDPNTRSYKIPVIQRSVEPEDLMILQEYDSISKTWEFVGQWKNRFQVDTIGAARVSGTLFFLTYCRCGKAFIYDDDEDQVYHIYYLQDMVWQRLELPVGLEFYGFPSIFEHQGELILCGGLYERHWDPSCLLSIKIWKHNWDCMRWIEVCSLPDITWTEELCGSVPEDGSCKLDVTAGSNFLCLASSNGRVAKCDMTRNSWSWLPRCDTEKYSSGDRIVIFEPHAY